MHNRELTNAALRWHVAHAQRLEVSRIKRRIDAQMRAGGDDGWCVQRCVEQNETDRQLAQAKRREQAALRELAKACARQRENLQTADVIDLDDAVMVLSYNRRES